MSRIGTQAARDLRIGGGFELWLWLAGAGVYRPVVPVNLSATGLCLFTDQPVLRGDRLQVRVRLAAGRGTSAAQWDLTVEVNKTHDLPDGRRMAGGPFVELDPDVAAGLSSYACALAESVADFLGEFPLFSAFSQEELVELAQSVSPLGLAGGKVLFYEGNAELHHAGLYIVRSGSIKIFKGNDADNLARTLAVLTPGEVFGEMSLIEPGPHHGSVTALVPAELLLINRLGLAVLRVRRPAVALKLVELIAHVLVRRLSRTTGKLFSPLRF